jgi:hypothetical protein
MYIFRRYITINLPGANKINEVKAKENLNKKESDKKNIEYTDYEELK